MGLAASQAKLLSITSRLSDNELRSQTITAAKLALANQSSEASRKYINSLNATQFTYRTYDADGQKVYVPLTGSQLSTYAPLKNQYALINTSGQILLSERDAENFENSADLNEFLEKYGITPIDTGKTMMVTNPEYIEAYNGWLQEYEEWMELKPNPQDEQYWSEVPSPDNHLYDVFRTAAASCYNNAMNSSSGCYAHVLAHMLHLKTDNNGIPVASSYPITDLTTSLGQPITIEATEITGSAIYSTTSNGVHTNTHNMQELSDAIQYGYKGRTVYAADVGSDIDINENSSVVDRLLSNYISYDTQTGEGVLKTLEQKCADLYYAVKNMSSLGINYNNVLKPAIQSFHTDLQLSFIEDVFDQDLYNTHYEEWQSQEPPAITISPTIEEVIYEYSDKDKAQWYVNLWHRINGPSDTHDGTTTVTNYEYGEFSEFDNPSTTTVTTSTINRYDILEDGLMNSQEWLKYALETGLVSLERVDYAEITTIDSGLKNAVWSSIIYTNALDISEETNDRKIAVAEAEYEQKQREIENKDKQYDSMLKLLDTEHNALQTEYDSVKAVISKNTERTLKIYSA